MQELSPYWWHELKRYDCWVLYLHANQYPYVGRCYAAAIREDADVVTDMTAEESVELFQIIIPEWKRALQEIICVEFRPNVAILGNDWAHLHCHLIPRYEKVVTLREIEFIDPNPSGNYSPYPKKKLPGIILLEMKLAFLEALS
jgi:diadenosine tetraphosphate (Ap4A) HIT family hydrolase